MARLVIFDEDEYRSVIADWVELQVLSSTSRFYASASIARARSILSEPEHGIDDYEGAIDQPIETEIADLRLEGLFIDVLEELQLRERVLGPRYPFDVEVEGANWTLVLRETAMSRGALAGRATYLACLLSSGIRNKTIQGTDTVEFDSFCKGSPEVVQILATIAAAELMNGQSYWMGWPRPDDTGKMRSALNALVSRLGYGLLKDTNPTWTRGREKDGSVDVVAWRPFADGGWASAILYGQVASGRNWRQKSISGHIAGHFFDWFVDVPGRGAMHTVGAMFIPYPVHQDVKPSRTENFDSVADGARRRDYQDFGVIVDRFRLVELIADRVTSGTPDSYLSDFSTVVLRWVSEGLNYLRAETLTPTAVLVAA